MGKEFPRKTQQEEMSVWGIFFQNWIIVRNSMRTQEKIDVPTENRLFAAWRQTLREADS